MSNLDTARRAAHFALSLVRSLETAEEIQWERSPVPQPREDTSQRASGGHGDPTGDIVLDPRRLALRVAVRAAEGALATAAADLKARKDELDEAIAKWNGE